uniref:Uncharacterized protein n=1 Tax=Gossypium raimondii TaxID=29730 RepID=A0A0D2QNZ0_GOSRA|nr:hypothetical protein B456_003G062500 [Gossypium raimondii]KJB18601.1 hypothetical protein B456_003G062500 [Gossypium raimondii]
MEESRSALHDCNLLDLGYQRVWFTWEHDRLPHTNIKEQLNCAMGTPLWKSCLPIHQGKIDSNYSILRHGGYWNQDWMAQFRLDWHY